MRTIAELLADVPVLADLPPEQRATIAACGHLAVFERDAWLLREGDPADRFYVIREGAVAIETFAPQRGAVTLQTLHAGDVVGWSWLVAPYRTAHDARAVERTHAIVFDGACLRDKCDRDPALGYAVLQRFAAVIVERLQRTRLQVLDLYDPASGT